MGKYLVMSCRNGEPLLAPWNASWVEYAGWRYCELDFSSKDAFDDFLSKMRSQWNPDISMGVKPKDFLPKAVFCDVDATLIPCESIEKLAEAKGCLNEVREITTLAMEGKLDFQQALEARLNLLKGLEFRKVEEIAEALEPYSQVPNFVRWCQERSIIFHMVSGGFIQMLSILASKLSVEHVHTNNLEFKDQKMTGGLLDKLVDAEEKRTWLLSRCKDLDIHPHEVLTIGDGANDLPMIKEAGLSVGFRPKAILYPHLNVLNNTESHKFHWKFLSLGFD
ncbi:MAG: phosphoserine phosphatase SerB [Oligoflexales bacterium]|nr:phosphoserine phosphatase SerB [Oligoflexales bacterium]